MQGWSNGGGHDKVGPTLEEEEEEKKKGKRESKATNATMTTI